ncbi:hypothetical protein DAI22_04g030701 [Oryza sativa Japonica Group]|nr:hypothetical protein DAI22_04g030701 [Oryza sativa Japonica Group]
MALPLSSSAAGTDEEEEDGGSATAIAAVVGSLGGPARARAPPAPVPSNHVRLRAVCCSWRAVTTASYLAGSYKKFVISGEGRWHRGNLVIWKKFSPLLNRK